MNDNAKLAELLFPDIQSTPEELEERFPLRTLPQGARVTRFAPSPTGFLHIGGLFAALISKLNAQTTDGVFILRIEDTDKKREITDGVSEIIKGLEAFGIVIDEGVIGFRQEKGSYGPYQQSHRKEIYQTVAKRLVEQGMAYPCFCSEEELNQIRQKQEEQGCDIKGYHGAWAACRDLTFEQQKALIEEGKTYTLRLRSPGKEDGRITFDDLIKGKIEMQENVQDVVLLKTDGIPTYHFAHAVDDHFMRTTHVIRGDEWISSVPLHIQLFKACGYRAPKYAHISPIMKEDNGGKRKLSKRKDPEAAVTYYAEKGYPKESVLEYLLTLANSNFEEWRKANPKEPQSKFPFNLKKMSVSGALFDLAKLRDVSKNVISLFSAEAVYEGTCQWAKTYDKEFYDILSGDPAYSLAILAIDRDTPKPRKDIACFSEVRDYVSYFFEEPQDLTEQMPENMTVDMAKEILEAYLSAYNPADNKDEWFARIKALCEPLGYTPNVKEYKKNPESYKGHVGDVSSVIRIAVTGRRNTPDLHAVMNILGEEKVRARLTAALEYFSR
ncbi:MAG: glutamate--tRNA ligase [Oscillospiraceae bacterium]|nr:glutamate--tRNA ligase [Oscillospiraceae bacterium]